LHAQELKRDRTHLNLVQNVQGHLPAIAGST